MFSCLVHRSGFLGRHARAAVVATGVVALAALGTGLLAAGPGATGPAPRTRPVVAPSPGEHPNGRTVRVPPTRPPVDRPNIIVVMLDDLRVDELRFAPNVRRYVGERGLEFRNSFSPYPLCCPARASFLLGRYAHNHGVLHHDEPYGFGALDDRRTIAGRLQAAGYQTGMVGKYLNGYGIQPSRVTGDSSIGYVPAGWTDWMVGLDTQWPWGSPNTGSTYDYFAFTQNVNGQVVPHPGEYSSTVIADQTRGLIRKYHRSGKPFFLWVTPVAPHHGLPIETDDPPAYLQEGGYLQEFPTPARPDWVRGRFDGAITHAPGLPVDGPSEADVRDKPWNIRKWPEVAPQERDRLRDLARQRAESVYAWDVEFGRIVERLKSTGEYDDTVIAFTSDNGFYLGEHRQRLGKIKAHEPVIRVPLVVAGPGVGIGVRYHPVTTVDLAATVLDLAGARPLPATDGTSQVPVLTGPDLPWTTPVLTEGLVKGVPTRQRVHLPEGLTTSGIRTGRWKLIRYSSGEGELYDLAADPNELTSRWRDPAYADVRRELVSLWKQYRSCHGAACRAVLPASLHEDPAALAVLDRRARREKHAYYNRPFPAR